MLGKHLGTTMSYAGFMARSTGAEGKRRSCALDIWGDTYRDVIATLQKVCIPP
jgi:hypothetical protein